MLDDILHFAACTLVDDGRVSVWMPTANDELGDLAVPKHEALELMSSCLQEFNKCECGSSTLLNCSFSFLFFRFLSAFPLSLLSFVPASLWLLFRHRLVVISRIGLGG